LQIGLLSCLTCGELLILVGKSLLRECPRVRSRLVRSRSLGSSSITGSIRTNSCATGDHVIRSETDAIEVAKKKIVKSSYFSSEEFGSAPDFVDSAVLRTKVAEAEGAEAAAIDRLAQLTPTGEGAGLRQSFDVRRDADIPPRAPQ